MNLKSKAISEIRSTILTLSAHPHNEPHSEFADRIEGLQVLLEELMQPEWVACADGLPGESQLTYEVCDIDDTEEEWYMKASYSGVRKLYEKGRITHYKLYVKPQPPTK